MVHYAEIKTSFSTEKHGKVLLTSRFKTVWSPAAVQRMSPNIGHIRQLKVTGIFCCYSKYRGLKQTHLAACFIEFLELQKKMQIVAKWKVLELSSCMFGSKLNAGLDCLPALLPSLWPLPCRERGCVALQDFMRAVMLRRYKRRTRFQMLLQWEILRASDKLSQWLRW